MARVTCWDIPKTMKCWKSGKRTLDRHRSSQIFIDQHRDQYHKSDLYRSVLICIDYRSSMSCNLYHLLLNSMDASVCEIFLGYAGHLEFFLAGHLIEFYSSSSPDILKAGHVRRISRTLGSQCILFTTFEQSLDLWPIINSQSLTTLRCHDAHPYVILSLKYKYNLKETVLQSAINIVQNLKIRSN